MIIINAMTAATKLRKKLFSIAGRSPDSFKNNAIRAKEKADSMMHIIPRFLSFITRLYS
jgi:hypothetical protein